GVAPGQHDERAGAGDGKINASRHQCLDARGRLDESDLEVNPLFLHVAPVKSDGINQMLKALARNCEVYGLRHRRPYVEKQQPGKSQSECHADNPFRVTSSRLLSVD